MEVAAFLVGTWIVLAMVARFRQHRAYHRRQPVRFQCPHRGDVLCSRHGCPDDPAWRGDGCRR